MGVTLFSYLCTAFDDGLLSRGTQWKGREGENTAK